MDKAELLATFTDRVTQFEKYQGFIAKAREQAGKFASAVVEKVVQDNTKRCMEIVSEIVPLTNDMEIVLEDLRQNRDAALDSAKESQFRLEELELRLAIGDLSEADFRAEASDYKAVVESTDAKVADIDHERLRFSEAIDRWNHVGADAGVINGSNSLAATPAMPTRSSARDTTSNSRDTGSNSRDTGSMGRDSGSMGRDTGSLNSVSRDTGSMGRDTGSMGRGDRGMQMVEIEPPSRHHHHEVIDALEADDDAFADAADVGDSDDLLIDENGSANDGFEVDDLNLIDGDDDMQLDEGAADKDDKPRRAVLLYQEGTAEEQIYPFTGEVMSLGRGRDNDVQVKNDSKVSRYHCKLYRRGPNFYIEDNKSANGTLVNGELITERRLFGGEEVIIGETFFRFRILD